MLFTASALIAVMASNASVIPAADIEEPNPKTMSQSEIRAFNAKLDKAHQFFIRCKRSVPTGSLVQRDFSCRTNQQWAAADATGNQESRDVIDRMTSKSWNTSN
ncbi:MAG: hypothetical protein JNJ92_01880 [Altererythrobacter sp.]|nr:hypothetical protein [Altererythrobacter sp.]